MPYPIVKTTYQFTDDITNAINAGAAANTLLAAAKLGCGTGIFTPGVNSSFADCVECTFTGYAQSATVVWGAPVNEIDGSETSLAPSHLFRCSAGPATDNVTNVFVTDGVAPAGTGILGIARLTVPIPIVNTGDGFAAIVSWNVGGPAGESLVTIVM